LDTLSPENITTCLVATNVIYLVPVPWFDSAELMDAIGGIG